jgi:hypothetical protein
VIPQHVLRQCFHRNFSLLGHKRHLSQNFVGEVKFLFAGQVYAPLEAALMCDAMAMVFLHKGVCQNPILVTHPLGRALVKNLLP